METQYQSFQEPPSDLARAAATSSRPEWVGDMKTWNDLCAVLLRGTEFWQNLIKHQALGPQRREGCLSSEQYSL